MKILPKVVLRAPRPNDTRCHTACRQSLWWLWCSGSKWARGGLFTFVSGRGGFVPYWGPRGVLIQYLILVPEAPCVPVKNYDVTKMSVNIHSFAPLLLRRKEPPMHNRHCRLLIDTIMKSLSPAARILKPLRRPSNRWSHWHHFIRLLPLIVHVVYCGTWYICRVDFTELSGWLSKLG